MSRNRKTSTSAQKTGDGFIGRLFAQTKLPAHVTEEQDWYLDTPDVRLTRVFTIVLILHVVAVGGILAFKMVEKASTPATLAGTALSETTEVKAPAESSPANSNVAPTPVAVDEVDNSGTEALLVDHPSTPEYQEYRVGSGDSLISIAKKLGVSASEIREINNLDSGSNLSVGRWIRVPKTKVAPASAVAAADPIPAPTPAPTPAPAPAVVKPAPAPVAVKAPVVEAPATKPAVTSPASYEVQKGDTLFGIARRFGIKHTELMAANGIAKPENLQAGQTLRVPKP